MNELRPLTCAVIGAGMAGVGAARELVERGARVTVWEKSRGFGGRCGSRRWNGHVVDHGAQYVTVRDERFGRAVEEACGGAWRRLQAPVRDASGRVKPDEGRWYHREGNSRLARDLAAGLVVRTGETVQDARAMLRENGGAFDHVISTAPWPQTARMFHLPEESGRDYVPCVAVVLEYAGECAGGTGDAYAFQEPGADLGWTACENHKEGRTAPGSTVIVAHLGEAFSRENLERAPEEYPDLARPLVENCWGLDPRTFRAGLGHRWRFARVREPWQPPAQPRGLHFVGDALRGSRVEDAWLAGQDWARAVHFEA